MWSQFPSIALQSKGSWHIPWSISFMVHRSNSPSQFGSARISMLVAGAFHERKIRCIASYQYFAFFETAKVKVAKHLDDRPIPPTDMEPARIFLHCGAPSEGWTLQPISRGHSFIGDVNRSIREARKTWSRFPRLDQRTLDRSRYEEGAETFIAR